MNKNIIAFSLGAIAGSVATYFLVKEKFEKEYQEYKNELFDLYSEKKDMQNNDSEQPSKTGILDKSYSRNDAVNKLNRIIDYTNYSSSNVEDKDDLEIISDQIIQEESIEESAKNEFPKEESDPFIITDDEFADPNPAFDKVTLEYFVKDDILIDSLSHEVMDVVNSVSEINLEVFKESNEEVYYVRNDRLGIDYEIVKNYEDYEESEKGYHGIF